MRLPRSTRTRAVERRVARCPGDPANGLVAPAVFVGGRAVVGEASGDRAAGNLTLVVRFPTDQTDVLTAEPTSKSSHPHPVRHRLRDHRTSDHISGARRLG